jgi:hypothetical protein
VLVLLLLSLVGIKLYRFCFPSYCKTGKQTAELIWNSGILPMYHIRIYLPMYRLFQSSRKCTAVIFTACSDYFSFQVN